MFEIVYLYSSKIYKYKSKCKGKQFEFLEMFEIVFESYWK